MRDVFLLFWLGGSVDVLKYYHWEGIGISRGIRGVLYIYQHTIYTPNLFQHKSRVEIERKSPITQEKSKRRLEIHSLDGDKK